MLMKGRESMKFKVFDKDVNHYVGDIIVHDIIDFLLLARVNQESQITIDFDRAYIFVGHFFNT